MGARALIVVGLGACAVLAGCPRDDAPPIAAPHAPARVATDAPAVHASHTPPGFRLPEGVTPIAYDLRLEVDPDREDFHGRVEIRTHLAAATDVVWLHAASLDLTAASYREGARSGAVTMVPATGDPLRGLVLDRQVGPGEITVVLEFAGHTLADQEGLFRQRTGGRWYLYSQAEAIFARRITPCFDEPRFKVPWRVTLVVPHDLVALGNAPVASEQLLPDGRREVRLAETAPLPTYLLAIAVGPFDVVDAGVAGRGRTPVRIVVTQGHRARAAVAATTTGKLVEALEAYLDQPVPWSKIDLVEVPHFFGAMENPGLITFEAETLVGADDDTGFVRRFVRVAGHELAHQWFGNSVTHAWWDDLWLTEGLASWMADKLSVALGGFDDGVLRLQLAREQGLAADAEPDARALRTPISATDDVDAMFDAIAYEKGASVLAMFEQYAGADAFRAAVRAYVRDHARGVARTADLLHAIGTATTPALANALATYVDRIGTPVVELGLRCEGATAALVGHARDGVIVPVCARVASSAGSARVCGLVGEHTELPLAACPAWVIANDGGTGYYQVAWQGAARTPPIATATPGERLALGDDVAGSVVRGDVPVASALQTLRLLAASRDGYAQLAGLAIARAIDPLVEDAGRAAWTSWLAARFATRLTPSAVFSPHTPVDRVIAEQLLELVPGDRFDRATVQRARLLLGRELAAKEPSDGLEVAVALLAPHDGRALYDTLVARALATPEHVLRDSLIDDLGMFGPALAPLVVATLLEGKLPATQLVRAVVSLLQHPATSGATWAAIHARWPEVVGSLAASDLKVLIAGTAGLCETGPRGEVAAALEPQVGNVIDGRRALDRALHAIDRCIARRQAAGAIATALPR